MTKTIPHRAPQYSARNSEPRPTLPRPLTRRFRRGMAVTLLAAGAVTGAVADHYIEGAIDKSTANNKQPACDVPVRGGDNLSVARKRITMAGDSGDEAQVLIGDSGHNVRNSNNTPGYFLNSSMGMQPGDRVEFQHVDPNACLKAGGQVIKSSQK